MDLFWEGGHCINFCPFNIWQHLLFLVLFDGHSMEQEKTVADKILLLLKLLIEEYSYPFWNISSVATLA